jgi:hypothetical protein
MIPLNHGLFAMSIDNVYTKEECEEWIKEINKNHPVRALLNIGGGEQVEDLSERNHLRWMEDNPERAAKLWARIKDKVVPAYEEALKGEVVPEALYLNERLRALKYEKDHFFKPHVDGSYSNPEKYGEDVASLLTVLVYLNEGFTGGNTVFLDEFDDTFRHEYVPKQGSVLVFEQEEIMHEGAVLEEGTKYVVRTDVMFRLC